MDFVKIRTKTIRKPKDNPAITEVYPDFIVCRTKDLMVRGKAFYAIWDSDNNVWSTDEYLVADIVDKEIRKYIDSDKSGDMLIPKFMSDFSSGSWKQFRQYVGNISDNSHELDDHVTYLNEKTDRKSYVSKHLPYDLSNDFPKAYDELIRTLYSQQERDKFEWAVGSILAGDSPIIQKFIVFYGEGGTGKSTIMNIIQELFENYYTVFDAKALAGTTNTFATEIFKNNPLVAIQHDGDLSKIEDNTKLNSIISHEEMTINEKYKSTYQGRINAFMFIGTNKPVKITDSKSGLIRRIIDVQPSGNTIPYPKYMKLMNEIKFTIGSIANFCLEKYNRMGIDYYEGYKPLVMMKQTDIFYNFMEENYDYFEEKGQVTEQQAYSMYKQYCQDTLVSFVLPRYKFANELSTYFETYVERDRLSDGTRVRRLYKGFKTEKFESKAFEPHISETISLDNTTSILDSFLKDQPAQYANENGTPEQKWDYVKTTLKDLDTTKLHYVKVPKNLIIIDFDLKDENGNKDKEANLKEASKWPPTYTEFSKSGAGVHLHYLYERNNLDELSNVYAKDIEIKVYRGNSALRRRLTYCNNLPIAKISSGIPTKEKKMINDKAIKSERALRNLIERNLRKEIHPGTKPSIDFICTILDQAYESDLSYDVSDMKSKIFTFAVGSTHWKDYCVKVVGNMKFKSKDKKDIPDNSPSDKIVFFDVEVFPNLFLINWKYEGENTNVVRMVNPTSEQVEELMRMRLVGFNNRLYDNHILYARFLGYNNEQLYNLSRHIINSKKGEKSNYLFPAAYDISYTDIYDFCSAGHKMSLKKWEIKLGIHHQELGLPWDKPVPEDQWVKVAEYCDNDVISTEAVWNYLKETDWHAREILAELTNSSVNATTNKLSEKFIFGDDKNYKDQFVYTDLSETFPGYYYTVDQTGIHSFYKGQEVGEGGRVMDIPGYYENVGLEDVESMHPHSIIALNMFGDYYTNRFKELLETRLAIKHGNTEFIKTAFDGKLEKYANDPSARSGLSTALKTVINSVYGLTAAHFDNAFKDPRNIDNIIAKRGVLFMIDLEEAVKKQGYQVIHTVTDSVKIPNFDDKIRKFVEDFGHKYGYNFDLEATYDKLCLIDGHNYIAYGNGHWASTAAEFSEPYVFKTLFSHEQLTLSDYAQTKNSNKGALVLSNQNIEDTKNIIDYEFIGKVGSFLPIGKQYGGKYLMTMLKNDDERRFVSVTKTKGYTWMETETAQKLFGDSIFEKIDYRYYYEMANKAKSDIEQYIDYDKFTAIK